MARYSPRGTGGRVALTVRLDPEEYQALAEVADSRDLSLNAYARQVLTAAVGRELAQARAANAAREPIIDNRRTVIDRLAGREPQ